MTKTEAFAKFGTPREIALLLGISRQAIYQWPETLSQRTIDRLYGAQRRAESAPTPPSSPPSPATARNSGGDDVQAIARAGRG